MVTRFFNSTLSSLRGTGMRLSFVGTWLPSELRITAEQSFVQRPGVRVGKKIRGNLWRITIPLFHTNEIEL